MTAPALGTEIRWYVGATGVTDQSASSSDATVNGDPTSDALGFHLDGDTDRYRFAEITNPVAMSFYFTRTSGTGLKMLSSKSGNEYVSTSGQKILVSRNGSGQSITYGPTFVDGQQYHCALSKDSGNPLHLWINGVSQGAFATHTQLPAGIDRFGGWHVNSFSWLGSMEDFRVFNAELTQANVDTLNTSVATVAKKCRRLQPGIPV